MTLTVKEFLNKLVQSSRIRNGIPNTVLGFGSDGQPEATLKSSLGGVGGAWTKVAEATLGGVNTTITATPSSAITPASVSEIYVITEFQMSSVGTALLSFGGISSILIQNKGIKTDGTNVTAINRENGANVGSGETVTSDSPIRFVFRIGVNNFPIGGISGDFVESVPFGSQVYRSGTFGFDSTFTSITNFVLTASQNMLANSRMRVFTLQG